jgi:hypothetical protein
VGSVSFVGEGRRKRARKRRHERLTRLAGKRHEMSICFSSPFTDTDEYEVLYVREV